MWYFMGPLGPAQTLVDFTPVLWPLIEGLWGGVVLSAVALAFLRARPVQTGPEVGKAVEEKEAA